VEDGNITLVDQTHKQKRSAKEKHREWTYVGDKNSEWGGQEAGGKLEDKVHSKSERGYI